MQEINEPMLSLELLIDSGDHDDRVILELNRDELDAVIQKLTMLKEVLIRQKSTRPLDTSSP